MNWLLNAWQESAARRELAWLAERMCMPAPGTLWAPALLAAVDQHAAAVRDILLLSGGQVGPIELAGYARGVQDVATENGWRRPWLGDGETVAHDWVSLRLAAVCLLAVAGTVAVAITGDADPLPYF
ncbi:MAG: DUF6401 family natural product biosynthesis protein [Haloechinothrix sp.]